MCRVAKSPCWRGLCVGGKVVHAVLGPKGQRSVPVTVRGASGGGTLHPAHTKRGDCGGQGKLVIVRGDAA